MSNFGISVDVAQWILTAYMLAFAVMLPTSGWVADRFGYKRTYAVGPCHVHAVFVLMRHLVERKIADNNAYRSRHGRRLSPAHRHGDHHAGIPAEKRGLAMGFWSIAAAASVSLGPVFGGYLCRQFQLAPHIQHQRAGGRYSVFSRPG